MEGRHSTNLDRTWNRSVSPTNSERRLEWERVQNVKTVVSKKWSHSHLTLCVSTLINGFI
jgi:hypothetical protein